MSPEFKKVYSLETDYSEETPNRVEFGEIPDCCVPLLRVLGESICYPSCGQHRIIVSKEMKDPSTGKDIFNVHIFVRVES